MAVGKPPKNRSAIAVKRKEDSLRVKGFGPVSIRNIENEEFCSSDIGNKDRLTENNRGKKKV